MEVVLLNDATQLDPKSVRAPCLLSPKDCRLVVDFDDMPSRWKRMADIILNNFHGRRRTSSDR